MFSLEIEQDRLLYPIEMVMVLPASLVAMFAYWELGICASLFSYHVTLLSLAGLLRLGRNVVAYKSLPGDILAARDRALAAFGSLHPEEIVTSVAIRAVLADRFVFSIRYSRGRPEPRRYIQVPRNGTGDVVELDRARWWPKGLR